MQVEGTALLREVRDAIAEELASVSSAGRQQQEQSRQFGSGGKAAAENPFLGEIPLSGRLGQHVRLEQGEPEKQGNGPDELHGRAVDAAIFSPPTDETKNSGGSAAAAPEPAWRMVMQVPQSLAVATEAAAAAAAAGAEAGAGAAAAAAPGGKGAAPDWSGSSSGQSPRHQRGARPLSADTPVVLSSSGKGRAA